ncbi:VOC family protein [Salinicola halophyticus]|uniref:VOC family protein n=1 Tax=Salinicola halophyticus TaxID=1808881 RepID=UPI003F48CB01
MAPRFKQIDHIHVHVLDRATAEKWYADTLGLKRVTEFEQWATADGPLMITDYERAVCLSLFERTVSDRHATIAFGVDASEFMAWKEHLEKYLERPPKLEDHELSWSLYFKDPDGNPFEITSYDYERLERRLTN